MVSHKQLWHIHKEECKPETQRVGLKSKTRIHFPSSHAHKEVHHNLPDQWGGVAVVTQATVYCCMVY